MEKLGNGVIHYVSGYQLIISRANNIYINTHSGERWEKVCTLPISLGNKLLSKHRWLSRLSRNEVYHIIKVNGDLFACFGFGKIYLFDLKSHEAEEIGKIQGSRPLKVCTDGKSIYYGVYENNGEREPIELYHYNLKSNSWGTYHTFKNIRHIHGVFWDEFENKLWATTGDLDHESIIWKIDDNGTFNKVVKGSQQTRAVDLVFTELSIFYATDAPDEENYIYKIDRKTSAIEKLQKVGGPVFYGCKAGDWILFSTVVEPSKINRTDAIELWGSEDEGKNWSLIKELKKDILPKKLFQYGQIKFPSGAGDGKNLYFSPYATKLDHIIVKLQLND